MFLKTKNWLSTFVRSKFVPENWLKMAPATTQIPFGWNHICKTLYVAIWNELESSFIYAGINILGLMLQVWGSGNKHCIIFINTSQDFINIKHSFQWIGACSEYHNLNSSSNQASYIRESKFLFNLNIFIKEARRLIKRLIKPSELPQTFRYNLFSYKLLFSKEKIQIF